MKFVCTIDNSEYENEELARDAAYNYIDNDDLIDLIGAKINLYDIINELRDLSSSLYYELLESAYNEVFENYFFEEEEEEEEEGVIL